MLVEECFIDYFYFFIFQIKNNTIILLHALFTVYILQLFIYVLYLISYFINNTLLLSIDHATEHLITHNYSIFPNNLNLFKQHKPCQKIKKYYDIWQDCRGGNKKKVQRYSNLLLYLKSWLDKYKNKFHGRGS